MSLPFEHPDTCPLVLRDETISWKKNVAQIRFRCRYNGNSTRRANIVAFDCYFLFWCAPASSLYTSIKKSQAVGKSSYKQGLPPQQPLTYKNYEPSQTRSVLRRARSGGCVAPAKKGSVFNRYTTA